MRPDASKATDLTSYATQTAPSSFTPTNVPYPGVVHPKRSASSSASGFSIQKPASTSSSRSPRFFSLARRASARSGPSSQSKAPSATSSQQLYSLNRPGMQVGGPRNSLAPSEGSHHSSRPSTQNSVSNEEIAKLGDVLPHARKDQLGAYIRKANGDSTLALQCFLEDERTGQLLC